MRDQVVMHLLYSTVYHDESGVVRDIMTSEHDVDLGEYMCTIERVIDLNSRVHVRTRV